MKKVVLVLLAVLGALAVIGVVADRAVASVAEKQISERIAAQVPGATAISTSIEGKPLFTQLAKGSIDDVVVSMSSVPTAEGLTLDHVVVNLHGVSTSTPRTADTVKAVAEVSASSLSTKLGDGWTVTTEGSAVVVTSTSVLPVTAHVTPTVTSGKIGFHVDSVSLFGVSVDGDRIPAGLIDRITALAGGIGDLPFGMQAESIEVTPSGLHVVASASSVALG